MNRKGYKNMLTEACKRCPVISLFLVRSTFNMFFV